MNLYLIQHARSKSEAEDPEKGLTDQGVREMEKVAGIFSRLKPDIHVVWHSGKKRARQTAEILTRILKIEKRILTHTSLGPMDKVDDIMKNLGQMEKHSIAIVGHLPHLDRLVSKLLMGTDKGGLIQFRNAGIVCLTRDAKSWQIHWIMTPEMIPDKILQ